MDQFERILARSPGPYAVGATPTIADYEYERSVCVPVVSSQPVCPSPHTRVRSLFDLLSDVLRIVPDALGAAPRLAAFMATMEARPNLKAYIDSNPSHRQVVNGNRLG